MVASLKDRPHDQRSWRTVCRRLDESNLFLKLSPNETVTWMKWILASLHADRYLSADDIEELGGVPGGSWRVWERFRDGSAKSSGRGSGRVLNGPGPIWSQI